ncbi:MAG: metal-dependent transcriptional regulator, partial [Lachnospiraceae bacterium]|nr:metal-dependent transcriptional regulator [Lachnospiraceae bacterium]
HARSVDIAAGLNVTKPSVSVAMKKLRENHYITMGEDGLISLTDKGYAIARKIYDRHQALTKYLVQLGVPEKIAREDACKIEHDLSDESFAAICSQIK